LTGIVYFDLETQRILDEVGGRANIRKLGLAAAVTYNSTKAAYHRYTESRVKDLIAELKSAELVVGYNVLGFDYEVLRGYSNDPFEQLPTVDMMEHLARRLGFRPALDDVASATLRTSKTADGLQAVRWYRQGLMDKVLEYCQHDVEITKQLYEYGKTNKLVYYWERRQYQRQAVQVNW
jgi:DEAD/DEAH box helicase domain-containing protein